MKKIFITVVICFSQPVYANHCTTLLDMELSVALATYRDKIVPLHLLFRGGNPKEKVSVLRSQVDAPLEVIVDRIREIYKYREEPVSLVRFDNYVIVGNLLRVDTGFVIQTRSGLRVISPRVVYGSSLETLLIPFQNHETALRIYKYYHPQYLAAETPQSKAQIRDLMTPALLQLAAQIERNNFGKRVEVESIRGEILGGELEVDARALLLFFTSNGKSQVLSLFDVKAFSLAALL